MQPKKMSESYKTRISSAVFLSLFLLRRRFAIARCGGFLASRCGGFLASSFLFLLFLLLFRFGPRRHAGEAYGDHFMEQFPPVVRSPESVDERVVDESGAGCYD